MAGFFGLFDYTKPGKGVDKGEPQKKRFFVFFEVFFRKFWKLIQINLIFILFSIPIVTMGIAEGGLSLITRNFVREDHAFIWGDFIDGMKKNWKQLLISSLINFFATVIMIFNVVESWSRLSDGWFWYVIAVVNLSLFVVLTFMKYYIPHMIVTFKLTLKQLYKNAAIFAFANFLNNLLISVILLIFWVSIFVLMLMPPLGSVISIFIILFIAFAFSSFLSNFIIYPKIKKLIIDPYYEAHPEEEKPFHLAVHDEPDEDDEFVFEDRGTSSDFDD